MAGTEDQGPRAAPGRRPPGPATDEEGPVRLRRAAAALPDHPARPERPERSERHDRPVRRPPNVPGLIALATAGLVAAIVTFGIFLPAIGALGDAVTRDPATLPDRITVCGRDWTKDALSRELTRDEVFARTEADPLVVEVALFASCPPGVFSADGGMATVVWVQTGQDAFVGYDLVGGP